MSAEREIDDRIVDWVDGRLADREHDRFAAELRVNPQLRSDLEQYERTVAAVRAALRAPTQKVQLADRVLQAIAEGRAEPAAPASGLRWRPLLWSLATAAALLVLALLVDAWSAPANPDKTQATAQADPAVPPPGSATDENQIGGKPVPALDDLLARQAKDEHGENWRAPAEPGESFDAGAAGDADGSADSRESPLGGRRRDDLEAGKAKEQPPASMRLVPNAPAEAPARAAPEADGSLRDAEVATPTDQAEKRAEKREADLDHKRPEESGGEHLFLGEVETPLPTASPPVDAAPKEPLPLVVVLGRAPAIAERFAAQTRTERGAGPATAGPTGGAATDRRFDEFFTAQVGQMVQSPTSSRAKSASAEVEPSLAASAWVQVADLRLMLLPEPPPPPVDKALRGAGRADAATWTDRNWVVEGSKQEIAALLTRLASFARSSELELRTGETTDVALPPPQPESKQAGATATAAKAPVTGGTAEVPPSDRQRIVLRFRLQTH